MSKLKDDLAQILQEKQEKIIPENIKSGVQIFDVVGTYEGEGSSSGVKLFETEEEMQADTTAKEGDLAVVYRNEVNNMTADSQTQYITFPETVTLPQALTESYYCRLRATDPSKMFDGNIMLDQNSFRFDGFTDIGMIRVSYTSSDGITYTREEFTGDNGELTNPVDLGTSIHCEMVEEWNDNFGYFMQTGGNIFEGLYQCNEIEVENDVVKFVPLSSLTITVSDFNVNFSWDGTSIGNYDTTKIREMAQKILTELSKTGVTNFYYFIDNDDDLCAAFVKESYGQPSNLLLYKNNNTPHWGINTSSANHVDVYKVNLEEMSYSLKITLEQTGSLYAASYYYIYDIKSKTLPISISMKSNHHYVNIFWCCSTDSPGTSSGYHVGYYTPDGYESSHNELKYFIASTQLTAIADYVYNTEFYGKNGVEIGTLTKTPANTFDDVNAEVYYKIQQAYDNMEPRVLTDSDKTIDKNIYFIPTKLDGTALLDTSSVTNMSNMFENCSNLIAIPLLNTNSTINMSHMFFNCDKLEIIPLLDTSNVTDMSYMFNSCTNLDNIPLLNTTKVNTMKNMFYFCRSLTNLPEFNTTNVKNMSYMLYYCENLTSIPTIDTSNVTDMSYMFYGCKNLISLPELNTTNVTTFKYTFKGCTSLTSISTLNIAKCKNFQNMFNGCTNLQNVPVYDVTVAPVDITDMFLNCPSLSDDSLNNILQTCINSDSDASSPNGYKTLKDIGLSEEQATKCTTLSNWQACVSAGWTTGY